MPLAHFLRYFVMICQQISITSARKANHLADKYARKYNRHRRMVYEYETEDGRPAGGVYAGICGFPQPCRTGCGSELFQEKMRSPQRVKTHQEAQNPQKIRNPLKTRNSQETRKPQEPRKPQGARTAFRPITPPKSGRCQAIWVR